MSFDFRESSPRRRPRPSSAVWLVPLGGAAVLLLASAATVGAFFWLREPPPTPAAKPPAVKPPAAPEKGPLTGSWVLEDDPSGGLAFAQEKGRRQMAFTAGHGRRMVVLEYREAGPGRLKGVTVKGPASAAPGGIEHELRYEVAGGRLLVWFGGERLAYVRGR